MIKLPLKRNLSARPPSSVLPLPLGGSLDNGNNTENEPQKRRMNGVAHCVETGHALSLPVANCYRTDRLALSVGNCNSVSRLPIKTVKNCYTVTFRGFVPLANCITDSQVPMMSLHNCLSPAIKGMQPLHLCQREPISPTIGYANCLSVKQQAMIALHRCQSENLVPTTTLKNCFTAIGGSVNIANCQTTKTQKTVPVPCRFYPIPEPPPAPIERLCRLRPPSHRLPLPLKRKKTRLPSSVLPLPLTCWHDEPTPTIPNLETYIVNNKITATIGGIAVEPLSFSIKTDMNSYAWSGSLAIPAMDYPKIKEKLNAPRGSEPLITVKINGYDFAILAEEQSRNRQFANHSYSLGGRSITARLGADYALPQAGLLDQDNYASQVVNQQLANLLINVKDFLIDDYFIPAGQYAVSGKTPIAVINDIATACGGFVETHPSQPLLSLKKRWKKPAWELATATPDVIIPADIIRQINDKKRINPRYNTATLTSSVEAGIVYRQTESRDSEAPVSDNPLYTDKKAIMPAGTAILSDSGIHRDYTLTMRWAAKYNIPLAELGQIWQINDPEGAWRGVVTGVSVNVTLENDAPTVWQVVDIDRYLDN